jgi:hypothetical protein
MKGKLLAVIADGEPSKTARHFVGLPPELTGGVDRRHEMGPPALIVIYVEQDGVCLYRYDDRGKSVGDTWHESVEEAKHQATFEYGPRVGSWLRSC